MAAYKTADVAPHRGRKKSKKRLLEQYNGSKLSWLQDSIFFIILIIAIICVFRFCIGISFVGGDSMSPTLMDGDFILYNRMVSEYKKGDIVSIRVASGEHFVKRVVGVGGDVIDIDGGKVFINGELQDESWAYGDTLEEEGVILYPYTVSEGSYFVLGDNRTVSRDSRAFGEVSKRQIRGRIILQIGRGKDNRLFFKTFGDEDTDSPGENPTIADTAADTEGIATEDESQTTAGTDGGKVSDLEAEK